MDQKDERKSVSTDFQNVNQPVRVIKQDASVYYSNCAMVATSPVDVCIYFGRYGRAATGQQESSPAEVYEQQVYMTLQQAKRLAAVLSETVEALEAGKAAAQDPEPITASPRRPQAAPQPATRQQAPAQQAPARKPPKQEPPRQVKPPQSQDSRKPS